MDILKNSKILYYQKEKQIIICLFCKIKREFMAYFDNCNHYCCSTYLDNLYDNYDNTKNELFKCLICNKIINDITYK
jgi:hypothetical protein